MDRKRKELPDLWETEDSEVKEGISIPGEETLTYKSPSPEMVRSYSNFLLRMQFPDEHRECLRELKEGLMRVGVPESALHFTEEEHDELFRQMIEVDDDELQVAYNPESAGETTDMEEDE